MLKSDTITTSDMDTNIYFSNKYINKYNLRQIVKLPRIRVQVSHNVWIVQQPFQAFA